MELNGDFPNGSLEDTVTVLVVCAKLPNGEVVCCVRGANGFAVVVVTVVLVAAKGEVLTSPNVDVVNSGLVVVVGAPKLIAVLVAPNGVLDNVAVVPKASLLAAVVIPNVDEENGPAAEVVVPNCEAGVAKGPLVVDVTVPNGDALGVDIAGAVL